MGKAYILPVKSNILEYNHIYLCTIIYICHLSLEKGNFSIIVVTVSISHVFRETDSLLISDTSDRHTKQKHNTKSSPDGIVMLIHNDTRIGLSTTISRSVSDTRTDGTRWMSYPWRIGDVSIKTLSTAMERQQKSKSNEKKNIPCSEIVVVSG